MNGTERKTDNDIGILASLDPVALDKACLDLVFNHISTSGDNADPLIQRINRQHGTHTVEYAEQIGLPRTISEIGATPDMIPGITEGTICYPAGYMDLKPEDITEILKESM